MIFNKKTENKEREVVVWEPPKNKIWKVLLLCLVMSTAISAGAVFMYDKFFVPKIISIDIKGYLIEQRDLFMAGKIKEEDLVKNMDKLEKIIKDIPKNKIILMGDAVIKNAEVIKP